MSRQEELSSRLARVYSGDEEGEAFHGPCCRSILGAVDPARVGEHPLPGRHSAFELLQHLVLWRELCADRLELRLASSGPLEGATLEDDWPATTDQGPAAWSALLERLDATQERLLAGIPLLDDAAFAEREPSLTFILHHDLHHVGQIALLAGS